jgi:rubrerythrin
MNLKEALTTAIEYEHRVRDHYARSVALIDDPKGKTIFATLAKEEQGHVDYLESRLAEWTRSGAVTDVPLPTLLPPAAWIEKETKKLAQAPTSGASPAGAEMAFLKTALELERTTSAFYQSLVDGLEPEHRRLFARFLEIEQGHVAIVQAEIDALAGHGHWFDFMEFSLEGS